MGTPIAPFTTRNSESHCRHDDDQSIGPDLGEHQLVGLKRHDQQMLNRSMLPFAQNRGAGQENRKHRDVVDDLVDRRRTSPVAYSG